MSTQEKRHDKQLEDTRYCRTHRNGDDGNGHTQREQSRRRGDDNEVIGEVPVHLRHLFNLGTEVEDEVKAAHMALTMAKKRHDLVMSAFSLALQSNAPFDVAQKDYIGVKICPFWQVVGVTHDEASTDMHGMDLGEMFRDVLKGRSQRHSH